MYIIRCFQILAMAVVVGIVSTSCRNANEPEPDQTRQDYQSDYRQVPPNYSSQNGRVANSPYNSSQYEYGRNNSNSYWNGNSGVYNQPYSNQNFGNNNYFGNQGYDNYGYNREDYIYNYQGQNPNYIQMPQVQPGINGYDYNDQYVNFSSNPIINSQTNENSLTQDIQFAIPVQQTVSLTTMSEDDWTWQIRLSYQQSSKNKSDAGKLEFRDGQALISVKAVPVGKAQIELDLKKSGTLIYRGKGEATVVGGRTTDATLRMKKVSDQGDLNIKPQFPNEEGPSAPNQQQIEGIQELKDWNGLQHVGRDGWTIRPQSL